MSPASDPPAEALPPESSGTPEDSQARPDMLPDMLPARRVAKAALPSALPAAGTNLPVPVVPAGPLTPQWPASSAPAWGEGQSGERTGEDYPYGPSTSHGPGNAGSFGGGAYHGPTSGGYDQNADYAESTYVEPTYVGPRRDEPRHEEPRWAQGNSGPQEADPWFTARDLPNRDYQNQGSQAPEYRVPDHPSYGGRHRTEGHGGQGVQGAQQRQGGYQGGGFAAQQPAPPPVPPNAQGYPDQSVAGSPGPMGGHSAQAAPQFGNGYPGRPAAGFPPPNGFPPPTGAPPAPNGFLASPTSPPPAGPAPTTGYTPPANGFPPRDNFPPANGFPASSGGGFPAPPANGFPAQPGGGFPGPPSAPPGGGFQSPPTGSPFPPPGFPSPPRPGEFQGFQPPNVPGGQPPGFGGQQPGFGGQQPGFGGQPPEGFQPTAAFPGPQPGQPQFAGAQFGQMPFDGFGQMPFDGPAAPTATAGIPWYQRLGGGKPRLLIGGTVAVVVVVGGIALAVPKLLGPSDPGCASYTGTALTAYNQTISDLNAQASQAQLTSDMTSAIADLTTAADQAKSATVKSALDGLSGELSTVRADVQKGSVSAQTVAALNSASRAADDAC